MIVSFDEILIDSKGHTDIIDITSKIASIINHSSINKGLVIVFVPGSTAALTTIEFEPGLLKDLPEFFEKIIPQNKSYNHDKTWGDGNGYAHLRASLVGPSISIPIKNNQMILGTWQQLILIDFDNRPRQRRLVVQILGD
ncbi:YjbQ family protein [candidate division KSB1 bacterium]|nr:YjbQ family protein [candidate division KSB1 bacterium]